MNENNPDDHPGQQPAAADAPGQDEPTQEVPEQETPGGPGRDPYGQGGPGPNPFAQADPGYRHRGYGDPTQGGPGYGGRGYGQPGPPYGPYGYGDPGFGPPYSYGPTPPRPSHASGPLMTPGDGGFGHAAPPPYVPRRHKTRGGRSAAVLVLAAVVAGGLAGVAGSAGYDALDGPDNATVVESLRSSPASASDTPAPQGSVEAVAAKVLPSVVKIDVSSSKGQGSGSGIILSSNGTILTNNHVVELAEGGGNLAVSFNDGTTANATIVGTDPLTDLAVIKAEGVSGLRPATLGRSSAVDVGEEVVAVGSPFGLESTVTSGIVSATDRPVSAGGTVGAQSTIFPAIQTDAAINPGNSGGALVDMDGEVIGINSAIRSTSTLGGEAGSIGLGFAIPVDEAAPIARQLVNGETPTHARLGVTVGTPENEEGLPGGAAVRSVEAGTAAAEAGLQKGDVITRVDNNIISSSDTLVAIVRTYRPGDQVDVTYLRDGARHTISVELGSDRGSSAS
jgi:putative serine protease PepD